MRHSREELVRNACVAFWEGQAEEAHREVDGQDKISGYFEYIYFVSRSNGRGRPKRRYPREVELLRIRHAGKTVALKDIPTKDLDVYCREALGKRSSFYNPDVNDFEEVVNQLRNRPQR